MTALDIQNHRFPKRLKGYDVEEVEQFRALVVEDYENLSKEAEASRVRIRELEARVNELTAHEQAMRDALVTAQGISEDLRKTSEREAQMRIGEAEAGASKILDTARRKADRLEEDIRELKQLRTRMAGAVRTTIETHLALLEGFSGETDDDTDDALIRRVATSVPSPSLPPTGDAENTQQESAQQTDAEPETGPTPQMAISFEDETAAPTAEESAPRTATGWTVLSTPA